MFLVNKFALIFGHLFYYCLAEGNPKPKITFTNEVFNFILFFFLWRTNNFLFKKGKTTPKFKIDDENSMLTFEQVDETCANVYTCTATNTVGNPVTSEFKVIVKCKYEKLN